MINTKEAADNEKRSNRCKDHWYEVKVQFRYFHLVAALALN